MMCQCVYIITVCAYCISIKLYQNTELDVFHQRRKESWGDVFVYTG